MTKIYLDQDGVLFDLDKGLKNRGIVNDSTFHHKAGYDKTESQKSLEAKVLECFREPGFFQNLPLMDGAAELWQTARQPIILTASPRGINTVDINRIGVEKRNAAEFYFGQLPEDRFMYVQREAKKRYAKGNILVDDSKINCAEWTENGGVAVWFQRMDQAVRDLRKLVGY